MRPCPRCAGCTRPILVITEEDTITASSCLNCGHVGGDALRLGIFSHVCPLVFRKTDEPAGTGQLVEISLVDGGYPGCQHARVLKVWEA